MALNGDARRIGTSSTRLYRQEGRRGGKETEAGGCPLVRINGSAFKQHWSRLKINCRASCWYQHQSGRSSPMSSTFDQETRTLQSAFAAVEIRHSFAAARTLHNFKKHV